MRVGRKTPKLPRRLPELLQWIPITFFVFLLLLLFLQKPILDGHPQKTTYLETHSFQSRGLAQADLSLVLGFEGMDLTTCLLGKQVILTVVYKH